MHPPEFNLKEADAGDTPFRGWGGQMTGTGPARNLEYLRRVRLQSAHTPEAALYQWPDSFSAALVVSGYTSPATPLRPLRGGRVRHAEPPDIDLGIVDVSLSSNGGFGDGSVWIAASTTARQRSRTAATRWAFSYPDRFPDFDYNLTVMTNATGAHRIPLPPPRAPSSPPAFLDPGEFRTTVVWESPATMPTRGPALRRGWGDDLAFGVHVASPEITAHVTGDVVAPVRNAPRVSKHTTYAERLDSDILGPLPATFTFSPAPPTRIPRGPLPASDGMLRDLPDANEALLGAWQGQQPQPPTRPLFRTPPDGANGPRGVWFDTLVVDVQLAWSGPQTQGPTLPLPRRYPETATGTFQVWMPLGDPMAWDVGPQPRTLPRPVPMKHEYTAAPDLYTSGASITVTGPYYAVAGGIWCAGAVAGVVVTE